MRQGMPQYDDDNLEARVEKLETTVEKQATQTRRLWGALLIGVVTAVLFALFPPAGLTLMVLVVLFLLLDWLG